MHVLGKGLGWFKMCHNMLNVLQCATQWVAIDWVEEARLPPTSKQVTPNKMMLMMMTMMVLMRMMKGMVMVYSENFNASPSPNALCGYGEHMCYG